MERNPYAAPQSQALQSIMSADAARSEHLGTESTLKTIGFLYYLGSLSLIFFASGTLAASQGKPDASAAQSLLGIALGVAMGVTAFGVKGLHIWSRPPAIFVSLLLLVAGFFATSKAQIVLPLYVIFKMLGKQAKFVLSPEYRQIIDATPHLKSRVTPWLWVLLAVLVLAVVGAAYLAKMGA